ncbi:MAG: formyltransferase family protein [Flavipsychrobacter sp.]
MKKQVVFLGSKPIGYQCFAHLIDEQEQLGIEIVGILTQNRKEFGNEHNLIALANKNNITVFEHLAAIPQCDIIYSVQYHEILKQVDIDKAKQLAVNLHMAPLPEYRGSNQFSYAIIDGKKEFGTTIHIMDSKIDHGAILFQSRFPIPENCWINELYQLTFKASIQLFKDSLSSIINGNYAPIEQSTKEVEYGTALHYRNEITKLKEIDLNWDKEKIERHIRATSMPGFEPPYTIINGKKVYFSNEY